MSDKYAIEVLKTQLEKDKKCGYIRSLSAEKLQQAISKLQEPSEVIEVIDKEKYLRNQSTVFKLAWKLHKDYAHREDIEFIIHKCKESK